MNYRELIARVQKYTGYSEAEAKDALDCMVEILAVHLSEIERREFAKRLPEELQDMALAVLPTEQSSHADIFQQYMDNLHATEPRAKKEMRAAWRALKETLGLLEIKRISTQLPNATLALLQ